MTAEGLPRPLGKFAIPRFFQPSTLGTSGDCLLQLAAGAHGLDALRLPTRPEAALGEVFHLTLSGWAKSDGSRSPEFFFSEAEAFVNARLGADPKRAHQSPIKNTVTFQKWMGFRARSIGACSTIRPSLRTVASKEDFSDRFSRAPLKEIETLRENSTYRLRGRPDSVRWITPRRIEVRDFKSGSIYEEDGTVKRAIVLQLWAYGLIIAEEYPDASIELIVDDGAEHRIPFGKAERDLARESIMQRLAMLPADTEVEAISLASPGPSCEWCKVRHVCSAYLQTAPEWWRKYPSELRRIPNDTWGKVLAVEKQRGQTRVRLIDPAGRTISIENLSERHKISEDCSNGWLWFFGLSQRGRSRTPDGASFHPHNFFELPRDMYETRAWAASTYYSMPE